MSVLLLKMSLIFYYLGVLIELFAFFLLIKPLWDIIGVRHAILSSRYGYTGELLVYAYSFFKSERPEKLRTTLIM
jgi:hypothetical protein